MATYNKYTHIDGEAIGDVNIEDSKPYTGPLAVNKLIAKMMAKINQLQEDNDAVRVALAALAADVTAIGVRSDDQFDLAVFDVTTTTV